MPERNGRRKLVQPGELSQTTDQGIEIPVPKRKDFFGLLDKAARKRGDDTGSTGTGRGSRPARQTSEPS